MATTVADFVAKLGLIPDEHAWERGEKLIEGIKSKIELFIGLEAVHKIGEMVEGTVKAAVEAKHLGERVGITSDAVQELGYAASLSGSNAEEMQVSLQHLARGLQEVATKGGGPAADALRQLGVSFDQLKGKTLDENLEILADRFQRLPEGFKKTALATDLFGRSGTTLIPLLNKGKDGIVELRKEAQKLGVVIDKEGIEKAEEYEHAQKKLGATLTGIKNQVIIAMLPKLTELVEKIGEWVRENRELVKGLVEGLVTALEYVGEGVALFLEGVSNVVEFLKEHTDIATALIIGLGVVIGAFAIKAAAAWVKGFWPIAAAVVAIAALALGIKKLAEWITGHAVSWRQMWEGIKSGGQAVVDWFAALPGRVARFFGDVRDSIKGAFSDAWDWAVKTAKEAWQAIKDIPIIGHIIKGGSFLLDKAGGALTGPSELAQRVIQSRATADRVFAGGVGSPVTFGDNNIHVHVANASASADEIGDAVSEKVDEKIKQHYRQAAASYGFGT
jgi:hypothetical protein